MNLHRTIYLLLVAVAISGCSSTSAPYGAPPPTSDPWQLINNARDWLQQGRPRAALPSLSKALVEVEQLDHQTAAYAHAKAAIHNELGRVYVMVSELERAELEFQNAAETAKSVPEYRPLHFDITYNLSTVSEHKGSTAESCAQLRRTVVIYVDLLAHPAEPPAGYGASGESFLRDVAGPRIEARARRIGCDINLTAQPSTP